MYNWWWPGCQNGNSGLAALRRNNRFSSQQTSTDQASTSMIARLPGAPSAFVVRGNHRQHSFLLTRLDG